MIDWLTACHFMFLLLCACFQYSEIASVWLGGVGLVTPSLLVQLPPSALPGNNLGQVVHTHVPLFTKQYTLVPA